jgi:hypothetical protein
VPRGHSPDPEEPHQLERIAGGKRLFRDTVLALTDERDALEPDGSPPLAQGAPLGNAIMPDDFRSPRERS